ncbi:MAG: hypothetical protein IKD69_08945, partial [Solobacterium sp.]|nr:hypothetical protein [Solobacterium sp.]
CKHAPGDRIADTGSTQHRVFDITFLTERTEKAVNEAVDFVNDHLKVLDENGDNMIVSEFDFRRYAYLYGWKRE